MLHLVAHNTALCSVLREHGLDPCEPGTVSSLVASAEEVERESGTHAEQERLARQLLATWQSSSLMGQGLGDESRRAANARGAGYMWLWLRRSWDGLARDPPDHPASTRRAALVRAVLRAATWVIHTGCGTGGAAGGGGAGDDMAVLLEAQLPKDGQSWTPKALPRRRHGQ